MNLYVHFRKYFYFYSKVIGEVPLRLKRLLAKQIIRVCHVISYSEEGLEDNLDQLELLVQSFAGIVSNISVENSDTKSSKYN